MSLTRLERLNALQKGYSRWLLEYPNEKDDDADSHLSELQEEELNKISSRNNS